MNSQEAVIRIREGKIKETKLYISGLAETIKGICETVERKLNGEMSEEGLNPLGEIQSLGMKMDRRCALLEEQKISLALMIEMMEGNKK